MVISQRRRYFLIYWLALAGLLLVGAQVSAATAAPPMMEPTGSRVAAQATPGAESNGGSNPGAAPQVFPCGNTWATMMPFPATVSQAAVKAHNGALYSFGGIFGSAAANLAYRYDPATDTWTGVASLPQTLAGATAVSDGTYLYILGGNVGGTLVNTLYRYNPATNTYTTLANLPVAASYQTAVYLNGKIYRIGGCMAFGCTSMSVAVDVYTVATNTWANGPNYPLALDNNSAVAYNGYIYVAGGKDAGGGVTNKTYRLDPIGNTWDDASIADLPATRAEFASDILNGRWIVAGGRDNFGQLQSAVAWDPVSNTWSTVSGMPTPAFALGAGTLSGALYVVGGDAFGRVNLTRRYTEQPACTVTPTLTPAFSNTPTRTPTVTPTLIPFPCGPAWITLTPAPSPVSNHAVAALNGALYSFGGVINNTDSTFAYRYDPGPNQWAGVAGLPSARSAASAVSDGTSIYILGGSIAGNLTNSLYRYDPVANTYTMLANLPLSTSAQAAVYLNGKIYRIGGCGNVGCTFGTAQVDVYTMASNTWVSGPAYPIGAAYASAVVSGGYIYVAGGKDGNGQITAKTYRLDPVANTWNDAAIADLPASREEMAGDMLNGRWILAGGRDAFGSLLGAIAWDPVGNAWATVNGMPTPAFSIGAATIGAAFYAVGGDAFGRTNLTRRYTEGSPCTATPTVTNTPTPTNTPTSTATRTPTNTPTTTPTTTPTNTPSTTPTTTPTNTPSTTPTTTPTNTPGTTPTTTPTQPVLLIGHVIWQGRPAQPNAQNQLPLTLTLRLGANTTTYPNLTTDASGFFTVSVTTLPGGVYTVWVKGLTYLASNGPVTLTGAPTTQFDLGQQRAGDVNNDNSVDVSDFSLLRVTFGRSCGDPAYDSRADWTGDCLVDIGDFGLLRTNFGQSGPGP